MNSKVNVLLEELHDRRVEVTKAYDSIVLKLNRRIKSIDAAVLIDEYSTIIQNIKDSINNINEVGKDKDECNRQIDLLRNFERDLIAISEKCLKLVADCEALDKSIYGDVSMECSLHAYDCLQLITDKQQDVESKTEYILSSIELINEFNLTMKKLGLIEDCLSKNNIVNPNEEIRSTVLLFTNSAKSLLERPSKMKNSTVR